MAGYLALALCLLPWAGRPGPELPGLIPFFVAGVLVTELATSFLLLLRFREDRKWSLLFLACAYLYSGLMPIAHLLTFPGAMLPQQSVVGSPQSTAWIFIVWIFGYALITALAVFLEARSSGLRVMPARVSRVAAMSGAVTVVVVAIITMIAAYGGERLPALLVGANWTTLNITLNYFIIATLSGAVAVIVVNLRDGDELFLWLAMALTAIAAANLLSGAGGGRYSVGWTLGRLNWVISAAVLFLYFMRESARQQRLLAQTNELLERRVAERTVELEASNAQLARSLDERDLLLREVYHRVKNNLQLVDSLIGFQASRIGSGDARSGLEELRQRVNALGLVHQQLMQSADLSTLDVRAFLDTLSVNLGTASGVDKRDIRIAVIDTEPLSVNLDFAVPLGLLTTELVSSSLKNATNGGRVDISLRATARDTLTLTIAGSGPAKANGRSDDGNIEARIVNALVVQLGGSMTISHEGRAVVTVVMPQPEARR